MAALRCFVDRSANVAVLFALSAPVAGMAVGLWTDEAEIARSWAPRAIVEPSTDPALRQVARERFLEARQRSERTIPELSDISF